MAKRLRVRRSSVVAVVMGVLVAAGCGGTSETKDKDGAAGSRGDGTAGSGGSSDGSGGKASGGGKSSGGQEQPGGSGADTGGSPGGSGTATGGVADGSGGAADGGTGGSSPTTGGTTSEAGASQGTGGFVLPEPEVGTVGTECSEPGALQCAGTHQRVVVTCNGDGEWEAFETCPVGQFCDTRPGETLGSCLEPVAECVGKEPGDLICQDNDVHACGVDTLTAEFVQECPEFCGDGQCTSVEPCPTGTDWINCSQDCPGNDYDCGENTAGYPVYTGALSSFAAVRTPAAAEAWPCEATIWHFKFGDGRTSREERLRVTVRPPWSVYVGGDFLVQCASVQTGNLCGLIEPDEYGAVTIFTDNPNAPPTNVVIEHLPAGSTEGCPRRAGVARYWRADAFASGVGRGFELRGARKPRVPDHLPRGG